MPGLYLHTSNRLELLAESLATVLRVPPRDPFAAETVVVQSVGMGRWLSLRLAQAHGICANVRFPFPQRFVSDIFEFALPNRAAARFYARENLTWRVMALLPGLVTRPEFAELERYLDRPRAELRRYQLAGKIATSFDQYLAFRPRMILDWEKDQAASGWQAVLWRELVRSAPGLHPPALVEEFKRTIDRGTAELPERVSLFGISSLPPFYLQFLQECARATDVHLFTVSPTPEYWADARSPREVVRARRRVPESAQLDLQFSRGNPLLTACGKLGREFLDSVTDLQPTGEEEKFEPPPHDTLLTRIQHDVYALLDPAGEAPLPAAADDRSLQFHSCHSAMREMEVLHDQLLALFEKNPGLKPHDIVVMAPDISLHAPFIEAVFDTAPEPLRIPFSISDRGARAENGVIDTFMRILESAGSRFTASSVVAILESSALQRRFELVDSDLETIRSWIEQTGIRWGIDAEHRAALGLPAFAENSWRAGLDRLLLGYAAPARGERLFEGILAFDQVEGSLAETLGRFVEFCEALFTTAGALQQPRSLRAWQETLRQVAARFFLPEDDREAELRQLRRVLDSLGETAELSGFDDAVPLDVLLAHLDQALDNSESGSGFLVGKVTFCALKPMRAVPFRVVCLVGMNDTAYPRHSRALGFDLIAQHPRPGDRSTRDDDRYLFLEALLSAREVLYVSFVGQSIRDNSLLPPSVLVSELLDYSHAAVTKHPLQPFSPKYFTGADGLFSYSSENRSAGETAVEERALPSPFVVGEIAEAEAEWQQLEAGQLINFFKNASKFFIRERIGLRIPRLDSLLEESEPLELGSLAKYGLEQDFLRRALRGESLDPLLPVVRASGEVPPGHAGESRLRELCDNTRRFAEVVRQHAGERSTEPETLQLTLGRFEITSRIDNRHADRLVRYRLTTRKPKDLLAAWIDHLVVNCVRPTESILISATKENLPVIERFAPPASDPRAPLAELLDLYWSGLHAPLPFFPRSSLFYAEHMLGLRKGQLSPLEQAKRKWGDCPLPWEPDRGEPPECEDDYFDLAFRNLPDPLGEEFQRVAMAVFGPALEALEEVK